MAVLTIYDNLCDGGHNNWVDNGEEVVSENDLNKENTRYAPLIEGSNNRLMALAKDRIDYMTRYNVNLPPIKKPSLPSFFPADDYVYLFHQIMMQCALQNMIMALLGHDKWEEELGEESEMNLDYDDDGGRDDGITEDLVGKTLSYLKGQGVGVSHYREVINAFDGMFNKIQGRFRQNHIHCNRIVFLTTQLSYSTIYKTAGLHTEDSLSYSITGNATSSTTVTTASAAESRRGTKRNSAGMMVTVDEPATPFTGESRHEADNDADKQGRGMEDEMRVTSDNTGIEAHISPLPTGPVTDALGLELGCLGECVVLQTLPSGHFFSILSVNDTLVEVNQQSLHPSDTQYPTYEEKRTFIEEQIILARATSPPGRIQLKFSMVVDHSVPSTVVVEQKRLHQETFHDGGTERIKHAKARKVVRSSVAYVFVCMWMIFSHELVSLICSCHTS